MYACCRKIFSYCPIGPLYRPFLQTNKCNYFFLKRHVFERAVSETSHLLRATPEHIKYNIPPFGKSLNYIYLFFAISFFLFCLIWCMKKLYPIILKCLYPEQPPPPSPPSKTKPKTLPPVSPDKELKPIDLSGAEEIRRSMKDEVARSIKNMCKELHGQITSGLAKDLQKIHQNIDKKINNLVKQIESLKSQLETVTSNMSGDVASINGKIKDLEDALQESKTKSFKKLKKSEQASLLDSQRELEARLAARVISLEQALETRLQNLQESLLEELNLRLRSSRAAESSKGTSKRQDKS
ncbi:hypothetical protein [Candidatus Similichlamydia epinepheli]|uniref:hypothetical protein n=1 Tax=Candidatus Similichlamydia epinepheli TaxID=1903953 RepID=UPI000D3B8DB1|nr:hypothetical protein [Candidatus Similichlamydia epinepheli]